MHLANAPHVNECRTAQEVIVRARAIEAKRRRSYPTPKSVILISPKSAVEEKPAPEIPVIEDPSLPCLLNLVVWPEWRLGLWGGRFTIREIQRAVVRQYPIEFKKLIGRDRAAHIVKARQIAMALCRVLTNKSYPEIGRRFGGKDHSTVIHAFHKLRPVINEIKPIIDVVNLADIVRFAFDAYEKAMPSRKPGSGRKKSTV